MVDVNAWLKNAIAATDDTEATLTAPNGEVLKVWASPLTPNDLKFISRKHPNFMLQPSMEGMVDLIIAKAKDENGQKAFTLEHNASLMRLSSNIVTGAFGDLFGEQMTTEDDEAQDARKGKS